MSTAKDMLGNDLTEQERALLGAYETVKALLGSDLPPNVEANVREAVAALWQATNGLALTDDRPAV